MTTRIQTETQKEAARQRASSYYYSLTPEQKHERYLYNKKRRLANPEKARAYGNNWHHKTKALPEVRRKRLLKYAKCRSVKSKLEFNLVLDDIIIPDVCPVFNKPFGSDRRSSASVDRIDATKGYIKGNIRVISQLANAMKWDSTREERIAFANWVLSSEGG